MKLRNFEILIAIGALATMIGTSIAMFNEIDRRMSEYERKSNLYFTRFDSLIPPVYQTKCHWCHFTKKEGKK